MLSHVSLGVRDLARTMAFYDAVLGALGYVRLWTSDKGLGYGPAGGAEKLNLFLVDSFVMPGPGFHIAFDAPDRESVHRFHAQALAQGGLDQGAPGPRPHFGPSYYASFVTDTDGYKLEAVHQ